MTGYLLSDDVG